MFDICMEDDKHFNVGDEVIFREFDKEQGVYTGGTKIATITYVLRDAPEYGLKEGYCIFGFKF